jgi:lipopolysaccharide biosynthesis protein
MVRIIAFYLPQYHPIPENDAWWGKGFTEWTNVAKAKPWFPGHYQPHLPADLGFYDLRIPEIREAQAEMAREYGITAFCYYHYWFNGKQLLERPFDEVLTSGEPDFPFCLCWANENWTRRWDGQEQEVLAAQKYSLDDDLEHIRALMPAFKDRRYLKVHGKPIFLVYQIQMLPDPATTSSIWREEAVKAGLPGLYLCFVTSSSKVINIHPSTVGFDAVIDFPPASGDPFYRLRPKRRRFERLSSENLITRNLVASYPEMVRKMICRVEPSFPLFPGVTPGWDNTPRRKQSALIMLGSSPELFENWLHWAIRTTQQRFDGDEQMVFINAWNEWAEGNHLEPDMHWGRRFLEATRNALVKTEAWSLEELDRLVKKQSLDIELNPGNQPYPEEMADLAFQAYYKNDLKQARKWALKCLWANPRWLENRGLLLILIETLVGGRLMRGVRRLLKKINR